MTKNAAATIELEPTEEPVDRAVQALREQGRAIAGQVPAAVDTARSAFGAAEDQLDGLSDRGVIAAVGFSVGITAGLFLAGSSRAVLAISAVPIAVTIRSAFRRGVRFSRLVN